MQAIDPRLDSWDQPVLSVRPMPGQRLLFTEDPAGKVTAPPRAIVHASGDTYVDQTGQRYLLDCGHHLPGVTETCQRIFWDT